MEVGAGAGGGPNVAELVDFTHRKAQLGQVDSLEQLQDDRVFLFSGEADTVVDPLDGELWSD